jgi:carbamoylphosphate synthase small subunit
MCLALGGRTYKLKFGHHGGNHPVRDERDASIAIGARFHIEANTPNGSITAETRKGKIKTWVTLDAAARWVRSLGMGTAHINLAHWQPGQRELPV